MWGVEVSIRLDDGSLAGPGSTDWTWHEVTLPVPGDAGVIQFGISLAGRGRVELRNPELSTAGAGTRESRPGTRE